ncbi:MAG: hypothetical protein QOF44_3878 [Streptomyces sp.]|nr:hypothetical protein [Streptomyces sp.]
MTMHPHSYETTCIPIDQLFSRGLLGAAGVTAEEQRELLQQFEDKYRDVLDDLLKHAQRRRSGVGQTTVALDPASPAAALRAFFDAPKSGGAGSGRSQTPEITLSTPGEEGATSPHLTVGVPVLGLYDFLRYLQPSTEGPVTAPLGLLAAFIFATQVTARYYHRRWAPREAAAISWVSVEFLDDPDVKSLRGLLALVFTQAISPAHRADDEATGHEGQGHEPYVAAASRHSPHVLRQALSPDAQKFLETEAPWIRQQFDRHARLVISPDFTERPLDVRVNNDSRVGDYLDSFLLEAPDRRVLQEELQIGTTVPHLDVELDEEGLAPQDLPLVLLELQNPRDAYDDVARAAEQAFQDGQSALRIPPDRQQLNRYLLQRLAANPMAAELDWLLDNVAHLSLVSEKLFGDSFESVAMNSIPGLVAALQQHIAPHVSYQTTPGKTRDPASVLQGLIRDLTGLGVRLHVDSRLPPEGAVWDQHVRMVTGALEQAESLLAALAPGTATIIAPPHALTEWQNGSAGPGGTRSQALQSIDSAVDAVLAQPNDVQLLRQALVEIVAWRKQKTDPSLHPEAVGQLERKLVADLSKLTVPTASGSGPVSPKNPPQDSWVVRATEAAGTESPPQRSLSEVGPATSNGPDALGQRPAPRDRSGFSREDLVKIAFDNEYRMAHKELVAAQAELAAARARDEAGEAKGCEVDVAQALFAVAQSRLTTALENQQSIQP